MMMAQIQQQEDKQNLGAKKFNMWIFIFTSFMFFAALTSGFIVYTGDTKHTFNVALPDAFMYSTAAILLSSLTMYLASRAAKRLQFAKQRLFLALTLILGIAFFAIQVYGWGQLVKAGIYFVNPNASQSFIYVFTGTHLIHILVGLLLLGYAYYVSATNKPQVKNLHNMQLSAIFWHFVDIIWIYLYVFLLLNRS